MQPTARPAGERRQVTLLLLSIFSSACGSLAATTALGKQVYDITGRELDLGLLGLAEFAPAALLVLVTGAVADRFDRRRVAAIGLVFEAATMLGLAAYATTDPTSVGPIFALVLAFGTARAFAAPASRSLPSDIVPPERLPWLVPRASAGWQSAVIVGPVLGGFLYVVGVHVPYLAVAALLLASAVALTFLRPTAHHEARAARREEAEALALLDVASEPLGHAPTPEAAPRAGWRDAIEGLRFIRRQPILLGAISLDLFAVLFGGAVALLPAIAEDRLGVGAVGLGWLRAAGGMGAAVVTGVLALRPLRRRVGRTLLAVVAAFGVFTIVLGLTRSYAVAFVAIAALSAADAVSVFIRATLVPLATPADKRGRVLAVENVFIGASNELGAFESGVVGQVLGPTVAIVSGGAATIAVAAGWWFLFPALRDLDQFGTGEGG